MLWLLPLTPPLRLLSAASSASPRLTMKSPLPRSMRVRRWSVTWGGTRHAPRSHATSQPYRQHAAGHASSP
eukprot:245099-Chlamydomonas_euryale.AAC.1